MNIFHSSVAFIAVFLVLANFSSADNESQSQSDPNNVSNETYKFVDFNLKEYSSDLKGLLKKNPNFNELTNQIFGNGVDAAEQYNYISTISSLIGDAEVGKYASEYIQNLQEKLDIALGNADFNQQVDVVEYIKALQHGEDFDKIENTTVRDAMKAIKKYETEIQRAAKERDDAEKRTQAQQPESVNAASQSQ